MSEESPAPETQAVRGSRTRLSLMKEWGFLRIDFPWGSADASGSTKLLKIGDRIVPDRISVDCPSRDGQPAFRLDLAVVDGVPQCRGLSLTSVENGRGVRPVDLDAIKLNDLVADFFAQFALHLDAKTGVGWRARGGPKADAQAFEAAEIFHRTRRGKGARIVNRELIENAAQIYRDHFNERPIKAVAETFGVSERTASSWITLARKKYGLLPETKRGKKAV